MSPQWTVEQRLLRLSGLVPLAWTSTTSGSISTSFHPSSSRNPSARNSGIPRLGEDRLIGFVLLAADNLRACARIRSLPPSQKAANPSSGCSLATERFSPIQLGPELRTWARSVASSALVAVDAG